MHRVAITGLGCITAAGHSPDALWAALEANSSGLRPFVLRDRPEPGLKFTRAGQIQGWEEIAGLSPSTLTMTERGARLGIAAARQADTAGGGLSARYGPEQVGLWTGCSTAGREAEEAETGRLYTTGARVHPLTVVRSMGSSGASQIAIDRAIRGPVMNLSTACSSAAHALGLAFQAIRSGAVEAALAGGHEAPLTWGFLRAWDSMRVVSPTQCRPFAADRDGMSLAEGAAYLALERLDAAQARGATIYAELVGFGSTTDAHHMTQPMPDGPTAAMRAALQDAARTLSGEESTLLQQVRYINAHGTATETNDRVEAEAIRQVFGERAADIPVSSTKGLHGHAMGASPAIEAVLTALALHRGRLPQTVGLDHPDERLGLRHILGQPLSCEGPVFALSNSLAFGGLNAVLAFRSAQLKKP